MAVLTELGKELSMPDSEVAEESLSLSLAQVREKIRSKVLAAAEKMVGQLIEGEKGGQLAVAKYLFEAVGLYPPVEEAEKSEAAPSLANILLMRMGLPVVSLEDDEDPENMASTGEEDAETEVETEATENCENDDATGSLDRMPC